jgi:hypothetical protein
MNRAESIEELNALYDYLEKYGASKVAPSFNIERKLLALKLAIAFVTVITSGTIHFKEDGE